MKRLILLPLLLAAAVSQAQDTTSTSTEADGSIRMPHAAAPGSGAVPNGPRAVPSASADSSSLPEFRGEGPDQPRRVFHLVLSQWLTNCYVLVGATNKAIIIDPTDWLVPLPDNHWDVGAKDEPDHDMAALLNVIRKNHLDIRYIISTHGHLDHVSGLRALKQHYRCVICMHAADIDPDGRPKDSHMFPGGLPKVDRPLKDADTINCDGIRLTVLHTPGHSPGSISLLCGSWVFSGDTLFYHTVGRTNFLDGSGNWPQEITSIRTRLYTLPPATLVLPGHEAFTTIGEEKANNPWTSDAPTDLPH